MAVLPLIYCTMLSLFNGSILPFKTIKDRKRKLFECVIGVTVRGAIPLLLLDFFLDQCILTLGEATPIQSNITV